MSQPSEAGLKLVQGGYGGLRGWIEAVESMGELQRVNGASWDAEMGAITVSPGMPTPSATIVISFELRNTGGRPLPAGVVEVRAAGQRLGSIATPPLPAGGSTRVSQGVTLPGVFVERLRLDLLPLSGGPPASITLTLTKPE